MAANLGRCINFGNCTKADTKAELPMPQGVEALCPECGKPLVRMGPAGGGGSNAGAIAAVLAVLVALLIGAGFAVKTVIASFSHPGSSPGPVAATAPPASTGRVAPTTGTGSSRAALLRLCGSNTIGSQLGPELAKGFLVKRGGLQAALGDGAGKDERVVSAVVGGSPVRVPVAAHGSATAFAGLGNGSCDVGMASRAIKPDEAGRLRALGDMTSRANEHVIGLDGIAVIVNGANPVDTLTVDQLRAIYTGRITDWRALHGTPGRIALYARDAKSGTYDTFSSLVLGKSALSRSARRVEDSRELSADVSREAGAIGFIGLPYVDQAKPLKIASGGTPIAPTVLTVGRETYPLTRRLYLYTAANARNGEVRRFVDYVQSNDGQAIVNRTGFVGSVVGPPAAVRASVPAGAPTGYAALVRSSDQLPFNFYFRSGSDQLDNKAFVDVGRLVAVVGQRHGAKVILAGFADSTGSHDANRGLSLGRARSVQRELEAQGVDVKQATGFGDALPIRDNATEDGRQKNRRVEIFLAR